MMSDCFFPGAARAWAYACAIAFGLISYPGAALAAHDQPDLISNSPPIAVTRDPAARLPGGPEDQLLAKATSQGDLRVLVYLNARMADETSLTAGQVTAQQRRLADAQTRVASRVLGLGSALSDANRFIYIPAMAMQLTPEQLRRLFDDPEVISVHEDQANEPLLDQSVPLIHADDVWAAGFQGTGQIVAIIDTGVDKSHPMLQGKVVSEACYSTQNLPNFRSLCRNSVEQDVGTGSAMPCTLVGCDHGTHVASIAAGNSDKLDGVARDANVIAIKVFTRKRDNTITAFDRDMIRALERVFALARAGRKIASVNMSIGGGQFNTYCDGQFPEFRDIIKKLRDAGIATVIASGNNGFAQSVDHPACISFAVAVGNTTKSDLLATSSNHSSLVDLLAPGTDIKAAVPIGTNCPGTPYCVKSGTSMAAPHVAGAWALLKNAVKAASVDQVLDALKCSGKVVDQRLLSTGEHLEITPPKPRIDVLGAFDFLKTPSPARSWGFTDASEALDWTPFRGVWKVVSNKYQPTIEPLWVASAIANCYTSFDMTVSIRRVDPTPPNSDDPTKTTVWNTGIFFKTADNYSTDSVSGYGFLFNKGWHCTIFPKPGEKCPPDKLEQGQIVVARFTDLNLDQDKATSVAILNNNFWPIQVGGFNTLRIVSNGANHSFYLNGKVVFTINDGTFGAGPAMVVAYIPDDGEGAPVPGNVVQVDSISIKPVSASPTVASGSIEATGLARQAFDLASNVVH